VRLHHQQPRAQESGLFTITHFVTANRWVAKKSANIRSLADLKARPSSRPPARPTQADHRDQRQQNLGMNIISANGHPEAFQMVETGRAVALDGTTSSSTARRAIARPGDYAISAEALSVEPYGIMLRKDDVAFKKVVNAAMTDITSRSDHPIYEKWFQKPIPPKGIT